MYLDNMLKNNEALLEAAVDLHQSGQVPANSWLIDLDTIAANAKVLASKARSLGLRTYLMSKQHNRNPYINKLAIACGLDGMVAVDSQGALALDRYNIPVSHVGHLNQIPRQLVKRICAMKPEVITVYNLEHARWIDDASASLGQIQPIMVRIYTEQGICFDGQEGGLKESELSDFASAVKMLSHVVLKGVTAFPCVSYNESPRNKPQLTGNMPALISAAEKLRSLGFEIEQINAPGNTDCEVMELLKEAGASHVEPGNALLGTTPNHAFFGDRPEQTAFVYVTEISHIHERTAFAYGGGVYHTNYSDTIHGLVGSDWNQARNNKVLYDHNIKQDIDYHMQLKPDRTQICRPGDSAVFVYRTQMHMTRSYVVPVSGISTGEPHVHYLFDNAVNAWDSDFRPVSINAVCEDLDNLLEKYDC